MVDKQFSENTEFMTESNKAHGILAWEKNRIIVYCSVVVFLQFEVMGQTVFFLMWLSIGV